MEKEERNLALLKIEGYKRCISCDDVFHVRHDMHSDSKGLNYICVECLDGLDYYICDECNGYFNPREDKYVTDDSMSGYICEDCASNLGLVCCESCESVTEYADVDEDGICGNCRDEQESERQANIDYQRDCGF